MAVIFTPHFVQFNDDDGNPLSGGKLYTYAAGTTTPQATYTTAAGTTPNANPVVLDSAGRATLFITGSYKFRLEDSLGNLIDETDNITAFSTGSSGVDDIVANFTEDVITTADSIIFADDSDGNSTKIDTVQGILDLVNSAVLTGAPLKSVYADVKTYSALTTVTPADNTIPQNTEGTEVLTATITPSSASSKLRIRFSCFVTTSASINVTAALFKDSDASAVAAVLLPSSSSGQGGMMVIDYQADAGSTSLQTYKVRIGPSSGTVYLNGQSAAQLYGGVANCSMTITEVKG